MSLQPKTSQVELFVTDIDNTLFDWVSYYVHSFEAMMQVVEEKIGVPYKILASEAREVFSNQGSIEYPFLIQELPSVCKYYGADIDKMLVEAVNPGRDKFLQVAESYLAPYDGVLDTLARIRSDYPHMPIVALTDAPRYVAMWKMNKLGLIKYFDAFYGLADPRIPTSLEYGRVKVDPEILLKHLQQNNFGFRGKIRVLPDEYEKPGTKGLKMVLMDYDLDLDGSPNGVVWVGDNLRKDVGLGRSVGVKTAWASYGADVDKGLLKRLSEFSPLDNIHKNANIPIGDVKAPEPDQKLSEFSEIITMFKGA